MRETAADEGHSDVTGRSPRRPVSFPDVLLYRGRASDGEECLATFDSETIVLSRRVGGLPCRIRLGINQFQAVAVIVTERTQVVRLLHSEDGLSIDLAELDDLCDAEEYCERLAGFLRLPSLTMGAGRAARRAKAALVPGERPQLTRHRRARFLTRRRTGNVVEIGKLEKREIIARG